MTTTEYQTQKLIFDYFKQLKRCKFLSKPDITCVSFSTINKDLLLTDFSNILQNLNLSPCEQDIIVFYGQILKTPKLRASTRYFWDSAIQKIENKLIESNLIKG